MFILGQLLIPSLNEILNKASENNIEIILKDT